MQGTQMTRASVNTFGYGMVPCNVQYIHCGSQLMCTVCICVYVVYSTCTHNLYMAVWTSLHLFLLPFQTNHPMKPAMCCSHLLYTRHMNVLQLFSQKINAFS